MKKQEVGPWMRWISVVALGAVMTGMFFLAGGFGSSAGGVARAAKAGAPSTSLPRVISITLNACADTTLSGSVGVADKFTGKLTLGLFALGQSPQHLTRQFVDTTQRATAVFTHALLAPFSFTLPAAAAPAYEVVVLPSTGKITNTTTLIESQAVPLCNTESATITSTDTQTVTDTATSTTTDYVTSTTPINATVTVTANSGSTFITTIVNTVDTTITETFSTTFVTTTTTFVTPSA